jgi:hypothetical protein
VDLRASMDDLEKREFLTVLGLELRPLSCLARSQSLYRLTQLQLHNNEDLNYKTVGNSDAVLKLVTIPFIEITFLFP